MGVWGFRPPAALISHQTWGDAQWVFSTDAMSFKQSWFYSGELPLCPLGFRSGTWDAECGYAKMWILSRGKDK